MTMPHIDSLEAEIKRLTQALDAAAEGVHCSHAPYDHVGPDNSLHHDAANCPRCQYKAARLAVIEWIERQRNEQAQVSRHPFVDLDRGVRRAAITEAERALKKYPRH